MAVLLNLVGGGALLFLALLPETQFTTIFLLLLFFGLSAGLWPVCVEVAIEVCWGLDLSGGRAEDSPSPSEHEPSSAGSVGMSAGGPAMIGGLMFVMGEIAGAFAGMLIGELESEDLAIGILAALCLIPAVMFVAMPIPLRRTNYLASAWLPLPDSDMNRCIGYIFQGSDITSGCYY